jgi:hypothetical protein
MSILKPHLYERANYPRYVLPYVPLEPLPRSHASAITAVCVVLLFISWLIVFMRLWTRSAILNTLGYDDLFIFLAMVSASLKARSLKAE